MRIPIVSVMMPAYNAEKFIKQAVESVLGQSFKDWQLIIVNDGSTDRTGEILAQYADPRIKIINQPNSGEAEARNTALGQIETEYLAFLDADDQYLPDHLEETVGYLQLHPEIDGIYSDGYYIDEKGVRSDRLSGRRRGPFEGDIFEQMVRASDVFGAPVCVVIRTEPIVKQKLQFDLRIVIGPDWDFLIQYCENALFAYSLNETCLYRVHGKSITTSTRQTVRLDSLAICRKKAVKLKRFSECSLDTRWFVFYDLLVNILTGKNEEQWEIVSWPEFKAIPAKRKSDLLRLVAGKEIVSGAEKTIVQGWFREANNSYPFNFPSRILQITHKINPGLCARILVNRHQ